MSFFTSAAGIMFMSIFTILFILGFMGNLGWKFYKLSSHKPEPGEKVW